MSDYTELRARLKHDCMCDRETMYQCDYCTASYALESQAREIAELLARVTAAEDALAADPIMTDKNLVSAVITAVMSGKQSERDDACRKLQRHILAVERERDARETECEQAWDQCHLAERLTHELRVEADALRARAEAAEKAIKDHNDGCVAACEARQRGDYGQDCSAWISRKKRCLDCARDSMIDYGSETFHVKHSHTNQEGL